MSSSWVKYRRVVPIFGIMIYYLGSLITGLDVGNAPVFLLVIVIFSIPLVVGLKMRHKTLVLVGTVLIMIASVGALAELFITIMETSYGLSTLGGATVLAAFVFHLLTLYIWISYTEGD